MGPIVLSLVLSMCFQWLCFVPAALYETEVFYDLCGSINFLLLCAFSVFEALDYNPQFQLSSLPQKKTLATLMVVAWTCRLGSYLFLRVLKTGKDRRFDKVKTKPLKFLMFWTIQGLWVWMTSLPMLLLNDSDAVVKGSTYSPIELFGIALWVAGLGLEVIADAQKSQFKSNPKNADKWISSGVWKYSRHPNYAGEIVLWTGMFVFCASSLQGNDLYGAALSPAFIFLLLRFVSGVPPLERMGEKRWGTNPEYQAYKKRTPLLFF